MIGHKYICVIWPFLIKTKTIQNVFGEAYYNKLLRKLTFGKLGK